MVKTWVSSYLPKLEKLYLVTVYQRNCKLWPLIYVTSKRLFAINVSFNSICGDAGEKKE